MQILKFFILILCASPVAPLQFSHVFDFMINIKLYKNQLIDKNRLPTIYAITPTYYRLEQEPILIRLSQTLMLVPNLHWIVVEWAAFRTKLVGKVLKGSFVRYTHLCVNGGSKSYLKGDRNGAWWSSPINKGLDWLRNNTKSEAAGVVYFMLDDSTYSLSIFEEISFIKSVGIWPIEIPSRRAYIRPTVNNITRKVTGFVTNGEEEAIYPITLTMFAVKLTLLHQFKGVKFNERLALREAETDFLNKLITLNDLEPLASLCSEVYVWSTRTEQTLLLLRRRRT